MSFLNLYTAKQKLKLKHCNACISFVSTVWRGEVVMAVFNNVRHELDNVFAHQEISKADFSELNTLVKDFVEGYINEFVTKNKRIF